MNDLLITSLVATFALGLATWHLAHIVSDGAVFEPLRTRLRCWAIDTETWAPHVEIEHVRSPFWYLLLRSLDCRLCLNTQVAILLTWGALVTGLVVSHDALPLAEWFLAFVVGPFLTAGWSEIIRRVECCEVSG